MRSSIGSDDENVAYIQINLKDLNELIRQLQDEIRVVSGGGALAIHFR